MLNSFKNLIKVKSIITLSITFLIVYLSVIDKVDFEFIKEVYLIIIGFYFGTQSKKGDDSSV